MFVSIEQLGKIRGLSLDELRVRSGQRFAILSDRMRRGRAPEMNDDELLREFYPSWLGGCAADTLRHSLLAKSRPFLPWLEQRRKIVEIMDRRFSGERDAIIN